jgi:hypothetical protein
MPHFAPARLRSAQSSEQIAKLIA